MSTNLVWEYIHEYAQGGTPCHGCPHALKESQEVGEAYEGTDIFEVSEEAKEKSRDSLKNGASLEAHFGTQSSTILPKQGTVVMRIFYLHNMQVR